MQNKQNKQQLIDRARENIAFLEKVKSYRGEISDQEAENLEIQRIALEKLTSPEPVPDSRILNPIALLNAADLSRGIVSGDVDLEEWGPGMQAVYAAPAVLADVLPGAKLSLNNGVLGWNEGWDNYRAELLRRITLIESGQWKLVPVEPTSEMMLHNSGCQHHAWDDADCSMRKTRQLIWGHMLAAVPEFE